MNSFVHTHSSSRFDRSAKSLRAAVDNYKKTADIVTLTEVAREFREKALHSDGWGVVTGDKTGWDDCAIVYDKARFRVIYHESYNMGGTGRWAQVAVIRDLNNGKIGVWGVAHYPAHIEGDLARKRRTADTIMWTKCVWGLKRRVNALKKKYRADAAIIVADWNIDFKKAWARALVKTIYPLYRNTWTNLKVAGGTHLRRIIDATFIKGNIGVKGSAKLLPDDASSDHRPYTEILVWL